MPRLRDPHDAEILRLAVPALGALIAEPLYVLADTAVVGRLGTEALAGLAVATSALLTGFAVFIFLAYGTTAAVARLLGAGRPDEAAREAVQALWLAMVIGVAVLGVGLVASRPVIGLLGAEGRVAELALTYLRISLLGVPGQLVVFAGTGYLRGLQDTRTPLVVAVAAAVGNLVLELILILGFGFGIGASAVATVVAQTASAVVFVTLVLQATNRLGAPRRPDLVAIRRAARVGGDLLVRTVALRAALTLGTAVAARIGTADVAAHEIAFAVWNLLALALDALAIAGQALIGRFLGASQPEQARAAGRRMLELGAGVGVVTAILVGLASPLLPRIFTTDPQVLALGTFLLWWVAGMQPVNALAFVLDGLLIGAGDMAFLARAMIGAAITFALAAGTVLALDAGIGWLWASVTLLMISRAIPLWIRWQRGTWVVDGPAALD